jgi:hypothetical protein
MVLLTASTVSTLFTSSVICLFTLLLFFSGYLLQQQSVRNIQHVLRVPSPHLQLRDGTGNRLLVEHENSQKAAARDSLNHNSRDGTWPNPEPNARQGEDTQRSYAYLQLLSRPDVSDICSAVLFFKTLAGGRTTIQDRLFMYPQEWDSMASTYKNVSTALSILQAASSKYDIWLLPIDMSLASSQGFMATDSKLLRLGQIQFMPYDGVLYLRTPGLLLDAQKLDRMLLSWPLPRANTPASHSSQAWTPMPLRAERDASLPPAYLITVNSLGERVEAQTHVPNSALPAFRDLIAGPDIEDPDLPAYVFFDQDEEGHVRWEGNRWFGAWRAQQYQVCDGVDLDGDL